jgi:eukaryotic-like serine/threonine-protein kinase
MGELLNDRYELVSPLGKGGMATVWRAVDRRLGREVAVKLLDDRRRGNTGPIARLHIEAQALARLSHPHIAAIHDFGRFGDSAYLVMELVHGKPLSEIGPTLPWPAVVGLVGQVADALASAHALGIVHRDVTASNVLLTAQGAKLIDFGICALSGDNDTAHDGRMMGTTAYLAPERLEGRQVGPPVDVYALGILMSLMLTGKVPSRPGPQEIRVAGLPSSISAICSLCLHERPGKRPTAEQVGEVLKAFWVPTKEMFGPALDRVALAAPAPLLTFTGPTEVKQLRQQHRSRPPRRGYAIGAAAIMAAFTVLIWQVTNWTPAASQLTPQALVTGAQKQATAPAASIGCRVTYQITGSGGDRHAVAITVSNLNTMPVETGWRLRFSLPGGQKVEPQQALWQQDGPAVLSPPMPEPLAPGQPVALFLTSTGAGDPLPADFELNGRPCAATIVAPGGDQTDQTQGQVRESGEASASERDGNGDDENDDD